MRSCRPASRVDCWQSQGVTSASVVPRSVPSVRRALGLLDAASVDSPSPRPALPRDRAGGTPRGLPGIVSPSRATPGAACPVGRGAAGAADRGPVLRRAAAPRLRPCATRRRFAPRCPRTAPPPGAGPFSAASPGLSTAPTPVVAFPGAFRGTAPLRSVLGVPGTTQAGRAVTHPAGAPSPPPRLRCPAARPRPAPRGKPQLYGTAGPAASLPACHFTWGPSASPGASHRI